MKPADILSADEVSKTMVQIEVPYLSRFKAALKELGEWECA